MFRLAFSLTCSIGFVCLAAPSGAQAVLVVDAAGGPGADFSDLQSAIDAALDGDVLVVRDGTYGDFWVAGKGLSIVAEAGARPRLAPTINAVLQDLPAGRRFLLSGFDVHPSGVYDRLLVVDNCVGTVWLQDLSVTLSAALSIPPGSIQVLSSQAVVLANCDVTGPSDRAALYAESSGLHVFGGSFTGGAGFPGLSPTSGGAGVDLVGGTCFLSGSSVAGGEGGAGGFAFGCADGGDGGVGLRIAGGAAVWLRDTTLAGGAGGAIQGPGNCVPGAPGAPSQVLSGTLTPLSASAPHFSAPAVLREGQSATLTFSGQPGDSVWWAFDLAPRPLLDLSLGGSVISPAPPSVVFLGTLPTGTLALTLTTPPLPPALLALPVAEQALFARTGVGLLPADPRQVVLLDAAIP